MHIGLLITSLRVRAGERNCESADGNIKIHCSPRGERLRMSRVVDGSFGLGFRPLDLHREGHDERAAICSES